MHRSGGAGLWCVLRGYARPVPRIGLVLGAGGTAGQAFHAGVLSALADAGWDARGAEVVVGTSAGSIAAALLRAGVAPATMRSRGTSRRGGSSAPLVPDPPVPAAVEAAALAPGRASVGGLLSRLVPEGTRSVGGIVTMVRGAAGDAWPDPATYVCAVRRRDGRRVVFGRAGAPPAPLPLAVAASCAIPGYFTPVRIGDEAYVDGGAHSPTNLDLLAGLGLDAVVVSSPMSVARGGLGARADLPARLLFRATLAREARRVRAAGTPVVTLQPGAEDLAVTGLNAMDPGPWAPMVEQAEATTRRRLQDPAVARLLTGP